MHDDDATTGPALCPCCDDRPAGPGTQAGLCDECHAAEMAAVREAEEREWHDTADWPL